MSRREFTITVVGAAAAGARRARASSEQTGPSTSSASPASSADTLAGLTLSDVSARMKAGTVTSTELVTACLGRIDVYNPKVNAFITVTREQALAQAKALDAERRAGRLRGPLHGIPIALKDNIDTAGVRTTAASAVFDDRVPSEDAEVARRLAAAGAVVVGKANLHEFAFGGTSATSYYGPVRNPWALERNPGGSSGGSAAAVATSLCYGALGTDTGGSIRTPASYCSVVGLKPTYGLVSIRGIIPLTLSLDHCGPITRSVMDAAMMLNVLAGYDRLDIASVEHPAEDYVAAVKQPVNGFRIGIARAPFFDLLDADVAKVVDDALRVIASLTKSTTDTLLPSTRDITVGAETYARCRTARTRRRLSTSAATGGSKCCVGRSTTPSRTSTSWCCRPGGARRARSTPRSNARKPTCRATPSWKTRAPSTSMAFRRFPCPAASRRRGCRSV